jgi:UDP-N-acetylglucosamine--N-acetylmuramyl-(pentapeptide) pyrophosphoryl-undecaprenol N-acetylglucosamine transferase
MTSKKLVFTGGHHTSALVVAEKLKDRGYEIIWMGHRHSMWRDTTDSAEYREVTASGIKFYNLQAGKFYRTFHPLKLLRIPWGFIQSAAWLIKEEPVGIVSFGGYLSVPVVITGWLLGVPSITHEQTIVSGWANRLVSLFCKKIAVTWPTSLDFYRKSKVVLVGLPLRNQLLTSRRKLTIPGLIYITGGKQGSHVINSVVFEGIEDLLKSYRIIHQTGGSSVYLDMNKAGKITHKNYSAFEYNSEKGIWALKHAEVVIGRSGAHTVYELGILGIKSVLIPIPWVSHAEQLKNAKFLEKNELAVVLPEDKLTIKSLLIAIDQARDLPGKPLDLPIDASDRLADLVEKTLVR